MRVLNYLAENSWMYFNAHQIAVALGITYDNVIGALIGAGSRYRKEYSLVEMGLVSCCDRRSDRHTVTYTVTALGYNAAAAAR